MMATVRNVMYGETDAVAIEVPVGVVTKWRSRRCWFSEKNQTPKAVAGLVSWATAAQIVQWNLDNMPAKPKLTQSSQLKEATLLYLEPPLPTLLYGTKNGPQRKVELGVSIRYKGRLTYHARDNDTLGRISEQLQMREGLDVSPARLAGLNVAIAQALRAPKSVLKAGTLLYLEPPPPPLPAAELRDAGHACAMTIAAGRSDGYGAAAMAATDDNRGDTETPMQQKRKRGSRQPAKAARRGGGPPKGAKIPRVAALLPPMAGAELAATDPDDATAEPEDGAVKPDDAFAEPENAAADPYDAATDLEGDENDSDDDTAMYGDVEAAIRVPLGIQTVHNGRRAYFTLEGDKPQSVVRKLVRLGSAAAPVPTAAEIVAWSRAFAPGKVKLTQTSWLGKATLLFLEPPQPSREGSHAKRGRETGSAAQLLGAGADGRPASRPRQKSPSPRSTLGIGCHCDTQQVSPSASPSPRTRLFGAGPDVAFAVEPGVTVRHDGRLAYHCLENDTLDRVAEKLRRHRGDEDTELLSTIDSERLLLFNRKHIAGLTNKSLLLENTLLYLDEAPDGWAPGTGATQFSRALAQDVQGIKSGSRPGDDPGNLTAQFESGTYDDVQTGAFTVYENVASMTSAEKEQAQRDLDLPVVEINSYPSFSIQGRNRIYATDIRNQQRLPDRTDDAVAARCEERGLLEFLQCDTLPDIWKSEWGFRLAVVTPNCAPPQNIAQLNVALADGENPDTFHLAEKGMGKCKGGSRQSLVKVIREKVLVPEKRGAITQYRNLNQSEAAALQGFPPQHVSSLTYATGVGCWWDALGRAVQVDTVAHLLKPITRLTVTEWCARGGQWIIQRLIFAERARGLEPPVNGKLNVFSAFDGIGGFPLAVLRAGLEIDTLVTCESEPQLNEIVRIWWRSLGNDPKNLIQLGDIRGKPYKKSKSGESETSSHPDWRNFSPSGKGKAVLDALLDNVGDIHLICAGCPCNVRASRA